MSTIGGIDKNEYFRVHNWLIRHYPKTNVCSDCGTTTAKKYDWALKKGHIYTKDIANFIELCSSCHLIYDFTEKRKVNVSKSRKEYYRDNPEKAKN